MKVLSTDGLTKLIQLIKSSFISVNDTVTTNTVTLATVATSGSYNDLSDKPNLPPTLTWYTGNTGTTVTIADTTGATLVKIYKNGLLLEPTADYSISGTTLTMVTALVSTDKVTTEVF